MNFWGTYSFDRLELLVRYSSRVFMRLRINRAKIHSPLWIFSHLSLSILCCTIYTLWRQSSFFFKLWKINIFKQTLFCDIWRAYCNQQYGWFLIALAPRLNKEQMHFSIANIWQYFRHVLCSVWLKSQSIEINVKNYSNHLRVYFCYSDRDVLYQQFSFWNDSESPYSAQQLPVLPCALINIHVICSVGSAILYVSCL